MTKHRFTDSGGDLRNYFAAIPNLVFKLGLSPYELTLYCHFKQAAGDDGGVCWKSRTTIARESGMSLGMVTKARVALERQRSELQGRPLITVTEEPNRAGGKPTCHVSITDIWSANMLRFTTSPHDLAQPTSHSAQATSPDDGQRHVTTFATSPHGHKEEPFKKNQEEKPTEEPSPASRVFEYWKTILNHPNAKLTPERLKAISARLRDGYSMDDICAAIKGCSMSPHNMGQNDRQTVYDDIELICRDGKHVEQFMARAEIGTNGNGHRPRTASERNVRNIKESLAYLEGLPD